MQNELDSLLAVIDQAFKAVSKEHPEAISCGKGCADCCHAVFDVSLVEAVNLRVHFQRLPLTVQQQITEAAQGARQVWEQITVLHRDLSVARVRCPLLDDQGLCLCYEARPVNCRTYGIPTVIDGKGHVCGFSGFEPGKSYPTVNLASLQRRLHDLSVQLAGTERGGRRYPISTVILEPSEFNVLGAGENRTALGA
ncbi:MAG: YkgJ family cysteine cluster protein [Proteobacteria bacterium]|nr:YkgJ family cysteine cluster protein [Pseudomonadota bacterium]